MRDDQQAVAGRPVREGSCRGVHAGDGAEVGHDAQAAHRRLGAAPDRVDHDLHGRYRPCRRKNPSHLPDRLLAACISPLITRQRGDRRGGRRRRFGGRALAGCMAGSVGDLGWAAGWLRQADDSGTPQRAGADPAEGGLLADLMHRFTYLKLGLAVVLGFVGLKMLLLAHSPHPDRRLPRRHRRMPGGRGRGRAFASSRTKPHPARRRSTHLPASQPATDQRAAAALGGPAARGRGERAAGRRRVGAALRHWPGRYPAGAVAAQRRSSSWEPWASDLHKFGHMTCTSGWCRTQSRAAGPRTRDQVRAPRRVLWKSHNRSSRTSRGARPPGPLTPGGPR